MKYLMMTLSLIMLLNLTCCSSEALHEHLLRQQQQNLKDMGYGEISIDEIDKHYPEWRRLERNKTKHSKQVKR